MASLSTAGVSNNWNAIPNISVYEKLDSKPSGWHGENKKLFELKYQRFSFVPCKSYLNHDVEVMYLNQESTNLYKTMQKTNGEAVYHMQRMYHQMGIAYEISNELFHSSTSLHSTLVEVAEVLANNDKFLCNLAAKEASLMILGDFTNALTLGFLASVYKSKVRLEWVSVLRHVAYEGIRRNYESHQDFLQSLSDKNMLYLSLEDNVKEDVLELLSSVCEQLTNLVIDASGEEVLEDITNADAMSSSDNALLWLFVGKCVIHRLLAEKGNVLIRVSLASLTKVSFLNMLGQFIKSFEEANWVMPITSRDKGMVYLMLYSYKPRQVSSSLIRANRKGDIEWPQILNKNLSPEALGLMSGIRKVIDLGMAPLITFVEASLQIMHMDASEHAELATELKKLRCKTLEGVKNKVKSMVVTSGFYDAFNLSKCDKLIYNWSQKRLMSKDESILGKGKLFLNYEKDRIGLSLNCNLPCRVAMKDLNAALNILSDYRFRCSNAWETKLPKFYKLPNAARLPNVADISELSSKYATVILNSRWCLNGLVNIRGSIKKILTNVSEYFDPSYQYDRCTICFPKISIIKILNRNILCDSDLKKNIGQLTFANFLSECYAESFESMWRKSDLELSYQRANHMISSVAKLQLGSSYYACSLILLNRLDVGLIYLISTIFEKTLLVGLTHGHSCTAFGVLFLNFKATPFTLKRVIEHLETCINLGKSEFVEFKILDEYFSSFYTSFWNSFMVNQAVLRTLRNLDGYEIGGQKVLIK